MSKLDEIYEGWKNVIFPTPEIEALAKERVQVCVECEYLNILNVCSKCICPKLGKSHSPTSRCPMNKWKDGWGSEPQKSKFVIPTPELKVMIWNELEKTWVEDNYLFNIIKPPLV